MTREEQLAAHDSGLAALDEATRRMLGFLGLREQVAAGRLTFSGWTGPLLAVDDAE
jgi:hypothetical protein